MQFRDDERGQAIQIGAVLLFAVLVIVFSLYQAFAVPNQNEQIELDHNVEVQGQLQDLRNAIVSVTGRTSGTGTTVSLGTSYPARIIALNPAPPSGRLTTAGTTNPWVNVTITNATAAGETGDVWNGSTRPYNTGGIVYEPNYNRYRNPPTTIYENTLVYNQFRGGNLTLTDQSLVSGNRISLVTLNGSFSRSSSTSTTVDIQPISSSDRTVLVEGNASSPITLNLTTRLSASRWTTLLEDEANVDTVTPAPNADAVPDPFTRVQITLEPGQYRLQMAKVGVGTGASEEEGMYLTDIEGDGATITRGESKDLILEVRDGYNNPKAGITVNGSVDRSNAGRLSRTVKISDTDGRVTFTYNTTAATSPGTHEVQFSLGSIGSPFDRTTGENVSVNVTVDRPPQTNNVGEGPFNVTWVNPDAIGDNSGASLSDCSADSCVWNVGASDDARLQLHAMTAPVYSNVSMDFGLNTTTVGTLNVTEGETDGTGIAVTNLTASENGTVNVSVTGGLDGDVITIEVTNRTQSSVGTLPAVKNGIRYEDGLALTPDDSGISFDIRNELQNPIRINSMKIQSQTSTIEHIYHDGGSEIEITDGDDDGSATAPKAQEAFPTDNSTISMDQAILSTSSPGDSATVSIRDFGTKPSSNSNSFTEYDLTGIQRVAPTDNWDIAVTFVVQNRPDTTFFFEEV